jgi:hypothetical protein
VAVLHVQRTRTIILIAGTYFNTAYAQYCIYSKVEGRRKQLLLGISALAEANERSLLAESRHEVQERERLRRYRIFFRMHDYHDCLINVRLLSQRVLLQEHPPRMLSCARLLVLSG